MAEELSVTSGSGLPSHQSKTFGGARDVISAFRGKDAEGFYDAFKDTITSPTYEAVAKSGIEADGQGGFRYYPPGSPEPTGKVTLNWDDKRSRSYYKAEGEIPGIPPGTYALDPTIRRAFDVVHDAFKRYHQLSTEGSSK